jgi:hypothetical protein
MRRRADGKVPKNRRRAFYWIKRKNVGRNVFGGSPVLPGISVDWLSRMKSPRGLKKQKGRNSLFRPLMKESGGNLLSQKLYNYYHRQDCV